MSSLNKVMIIGHLGTDPEVKETSSSHVCNLSVATGEKWKDKDGAIQERTEWHRVVVWGKTAEQCGKYLTKGRLVYVEGRLQTRKYDDKEGVTRYTTEVVADTVTFLGSGASGDQPRNANGAAGQPSSPPRKEQGGTKSASKSGSAPRGGFDHSFTDDDIPF